MTDFAKPTTAAAALRQAAKDHDFYIGVEEQKIAQAKARISALTESRERLLRDADGYEKWQPTGTPDDAASGLADGGKQTFSERDE